MGRIFLAVIALMQMVESPTGASAVPPKPTTSPMNWVTPDDYPSEAADSGKGGIVHFSLVVDATGKPDSCHITSTSGFLELDQVSCAIFLKRARFHPARDAEGNPIRGVYAGTYVWNVWGNSQPAEVPRIDLIVQVAKLPAGYAAPVLTRVHFGASGKPDACRVEATSGNPGIDKVACAQVMLQAPSPTKGVKGLPPYDTQMVLVAFEPAPPK